jgi:hypothetical protein
MQRKHKFCSLLFCAITAAGKDSGLEAPSSVPVAGARIAQAHRDKRQNGHNVGDELKGVVT